YPVDFNGGTVESEFTPYIKPQESGNKTQVSFVSLTNLENTGISITGNALNFSTSEYTLDELK
ncbi:MAG TPA: hypothetical protein DCQ31_04380, partial [Bacteroidales bacterium]|nr:hypothetical protein [Bacteroidales bacterium]